MRAARRPREDEDLPHHQRWRGLTRIGRSARSHEQPPRRRTFRSLQIRAYRIYAAGALVSNIGTWAQRIAQDWMILVLTGSGTVLGISAGLQLLPALLLSPLAGALADRWPRRTILTCTQVAMALPSLTLGVLAVTGVAQTWHVLGLAFAFGVATAVDAPARQTFAAELVEPHDVGNAIALNSASMNTARLVGPAAAGAAIAALGGGVVATGWVVLANVLSYLAVLVALWRIRATELHSPPRPTVRPTILDGFAYVLGRPDLRFLLCCALVIGVAGQAFVTLSALMVVDVYGLGSREYGIAAAAGAVGSLVGALAVARSGGARLRWLAACGVGFGLLQLVASVAPGYWTWVALMPLVSMAALSMTTAANAAVQSTSAPGLRGRAVAAFLMVMMGGAPVGAPALGWLADATSPRVAVAAGGAFTLVVMVVATAALHRAQHRPRGTFVEPHVRPR